MRLERVLRNAIPQPDTRITLGKSERVVSLQFKHRVHRHIRWMVAVNVNTGKVLSYRKNLRKKGNHWVEEPADVTKALCLAAFPEYLIEAGVSNWRDK